MKRIHVRAINDIDAKGDPAIPEIVISYYSNEQEREIILHFDNFCELEWLVYVIQKHIRRAEACINHVKKQMQDC